MSSSATGVGMPICFLGAILLILTQKSSQKFGDVLGIMVLDFIQTIRRTLGKHDQLGIANKTRRQPITTTLGKLYVVAVVLHDATKWLQVLLLMYYVQQRGIIFINDDYHLRARLPVSPLHQVF